MFRSAATKIAHNSTIPNLGGNKDLKPLQDLITAEKAVLVSLQKLSADLVKSSECLRNWGLGEGEALGDVLTSSTTLLGYVAAALAQYAQHEQVIREYMKSVRSREENLDDLRRRRRQVVAKADSAEKKLTKMSPEHKSLHQQTELLNNLREQIRSMDSQILTEEASLSDFKRSSAKNWMVLKFGGLLELAEKSTVTVVSDLGKLILEEIPLDQTQPGFGRPLYSGHEKTQKIVEEAQRCIAEIAFDPQPVSIGPSSAMDMSVIPHSESTANFQQPQQQVRKQGSKMSFSEQRQGDAGRSIDGLPSTSSATLEASQFRKGGVWEPPTGSPPSQGSGFGYDHERQPSSVLGGGSLGLESYMGDGADEFGVRDSSNFSKGYGTMPNPGAGSRFAQGGDQGFGAPSSSKFAGGSNNMATAGHFASFPVRKGSVGQNDNPSPPPLPPDSMRQPPAQPLTLGTHPPSDFGGDMDLGFAAEIEKALANHDANGPLPSYEAGNYNGATQDGHLGMTSLPPGAALPAPWNGSVGGQSMPNPHHDESAAYGGMEADEDHDGRLSYDSRSQERSPLPVKKRISRHVKFGQDGSETDESGDRDDTSSAQRKAQDIAPEIPDEDDSVAAHAAAAREVSRELDALNFSPPPPPPPPSINPTAASSYNPLSGPPKRTPSPTIMPAPLFVHEPQPANTSDNYGTELGYGPPPRTDATPQPPPDLSVPRPEMRSVSEGNPSYNSQPPKLISDHIRPSLNINMPSSQASFATTAFATPPEYPASPTSMNAPRGARTPSPLPPSSQPGASPPTGTRTISAAAFKRGGRTPSIPGSPGGPGLAGIGSGTGIPGSGLAGIGSGGGGPSGYVETKPLSVNKRPLPSSPYPPSLRTGSPAPTFGSSSTSYGQPTLTTDSASSQRDSVASGPGQGSEVSSDRPSYESGPGSPRSGYAQERFVTNLED